ncbi:fimbria/pilus outer membrane usher protein [Mesorhizobium sp. MSK_1335]|uniref:Fimbria/pilus outer membrane usher protein n=1 Tax=Mesorhizobium montanum TaxID=3072323 RepID=A0ABU4ZSX9_9HYPH|nr:fimbria/pilus outer membrane usher protein [Mesorhizobium sp. MSK_1335]MDX8528510.1 fimbria/pilus outer membrane usher protein [Mesorhizobium sp. MSK_1335]
MKAARLLGFSILLLTLKQFDPAAAATQQFQLEVFVNGVSTNQIAAFTSPDGQHFGTGPDELRALGLAVGKDRLDDATVMLDTIQGLDYRYEERQQRLFLSINEGLRGTMAYDAMPGGEAPPQAEAGTGGVLNYNLFATSRRDADKTDFAFSGVSATLDARAFSPIGSLGQSAILRLDQDGRADALRLDTTFSYSDPERLVTYQAGDAISGGFAWTRPIRIGGLQLRRNFGLRADLITQPLASVRGSAAVPSTVDVYVNDAKAYSHDIGAGPFRITDIPVTTGGGEARVVLRDAAGHETRTTVPFYASPNLLRPGLSDFSLEAGLPRLGYGTSSDAYALNQPVVSASLRKGVFDWLTLEGHAEASGRMVNGGAGLVTRTGSLGVASFALSASHGDTGNGAQAYASYEMRLGSLSINASSQMTFGHYDDLASATDRFRERTGADHAFFNLLDFDTKTDGSAQSGRPQKMVNSVSFGMPLSSGNDSIGASYIDLTSATGESSRIITASYSRTLSFGYFNATAFAELCGDRHVGLFGALSIPIGGDTMASSAVSAGRDGVEALAEVSKPLGQEPGSIGWRASFSQKSTEGAAAASYRSSYGQADAAVIHSSSGTTATAQVDGAIASMGSGVFLTDRIDDSFAVVETGVPNVGVFYENRPAGTTDAHGRLLLPGLRSYQRNKIAIGAADLPVDAEVATTQDVVAPADRAGVRVDFRVRTNINAAVLVVSTPDGQPLAVGSQVEVNGNPDVLVGYDGRAYVTGLAGRNTLTATTAQGSCQASFSYRSRANEQVVIPVVCR